MNKLLELQLNVWKLTGTINRLQSVETRSTDEDTELTTATAEYADVNAQAGRGGRTRADPTCGRTPGPYHRPGRPRAAGARKACQPGGRSYGSTGASYAGRRDPRSAASVRVRAEPMAR